MDLKLFGMWHEQGNAEATADELASIVSCDPELLSELQFGDMSVVGIPGRGLTDTCSCSPIVATSCCQSYPRRAFDRAFQADCTVDFFSSARLRGMDPSPVRSYTQHLIIRRQCLPKRPSYDATLPCFFKMPEYLSQTGYKNPIDPKDGVFQFAKGWKDDMFNYYESHPREGESFNHVMGGVMAQQGGWLDIFPHETLLEAGAKEPETALLVDVGGNIGHDIEKFRQAHPETAARLYLEDRPEVVERATCGELINKVGYDFFTPQPIRGARTYYMHGVLHDWSDEPAHKILEMQREALVPGFSNLLVHDHIAPRALAHPHTTAYDLTMMVMVAGKERTEEHWRELLELAGYAVKRVWTSPLTVQGIIEAEVRE